MTAIITTAAYAAIKTIADAPAKRSDYLGRVRWHVALDTIEVTAETMAAHNSGLIDMGCGTVSVTDAGYKMLTAYEHTARAAEGGDDADVWQDAADNAVALFDECYGDVYGDRLAVLRREARIVRRR